MTTKDFQNRGLLRIFLSYFKPHRRLFALDMTCAFLIAVVDLAFPLVSRTALYTWLPEKQFRVFFLVMALVVAGDTITCRGLGKCVLDSVGSPTKKGRLPVVIRRFV